MAQQQECPHIHLTYIFVFVFIIQQHLVSQGNVENFCFSTALFVFKKWCSTRQMWLFPMSCTQLHLFIKNLSREFFCYLSQYAPRDLLLAGANFAKDGSKECFCLHKQKNIALFSCNSNLCPIPNSNCGVWGSCWTSSTCGHVRHRVVTKACVLTAGAGKENVVVCKVCFNNVGRFCRVQSIERSYGAVVKFCWLWTHVVKGCWLCGNMLCTLCFVWAEAQKDCVL